MIDFSIVMVLDKKGEVEGYNKSGRRKLLNNLDVSLVSRA